MVNEMSEKEYPLPPATFDFLVLSLKTQIEVHLGLLHFGDEKERPEPEFRMARHSIDLLAMIQEKTRGNLTIEEQRLIENAAHRAALPLRPGPGAAPEEDPLAPPKQ